jgi:hypothetical protein
MNEVYQQKSGKPILFSQLGKSIEHFNFFLTQSISQTLNISSLRNGGATSESLVNRLLQVSSQGKFSQIDTFVRKIAATKLATQAKLAEETKLEFISEGGEKDEDDEEIKELDREVEAALDQAAAEEEKNVEVEMETEVNMNTDLMIRKFTSSKCKEYEAVCHSFFIAKDNVEINWRRPYVQKSSVHC